MLAASRKDQLWHRPEVLSLKEQRSEPGSGGGLTTVPHLTWVLATTTPLDEADDEKDQHQKGDGTHEPDEPALGGNVCLVIGISWQGEWEANHEPLLGEW